MLFVYFRSTTPHWLWPRKSAQGRTLTPRASTPHTTPTTCQRQTWHPSAIAPCAPQGATGWVAAPSENAHPVHRQRCRSLLIAVLQYLAHRTRLLIWRTAGKQCWEGFWVSRGTEHGSCADREIAWYWACAMDWSAQTGRRCIPSP